jgi:hypothetical protein
VEIKPAHEAIYERTRDTKDLIQHVRNMAKWQAAEFWCQRRGDVEFAVLTEADIPFDVQSEKPKRKYGKRRIKKV